MSDPVELDVDLAEVPVTLTRKGKKEQFTIREMTGDALEAFMEENKDRVDAVVKDGKLEVKGLKSYKGLFTTLVKHCLFDAQGNIVPLNVIQAFPLRVQQQLAKMAQDINALSPDAKEEAGNSPTGSEPGCASLPGSTAPSPDASGKPEPGSSSNG